jgi:hypothetical protein
MLGKLKKREDEAETRIDSLESMVRKEIDGSLTSRITAVESRLESTLDSRLEKHITKSKVGHPKDIETKTSCSCSSWPFYLTMLMNIGVFGFTLYTYRLSRKHHLP